MMTEKQLRILIADDQPYMRRAVKALLESQDGWVVCGEAADGLEAIEKRKNYSRTWWSWTCSCRT